MSELQRAAEAVAQAQSLALACHVGPDGDALGSMLAFGIAARNNGKDVVASFGSPFDVPANLRFLPTDLLVAPGDFPEQPETMVVFDAGSADRLGELGTHAGKATTLIVLDHHATNEGFGDVAVIDSSAAATGEIVFELFGLLGWDIDSQIATCLHTSLVTDTGRFSYSNTTSETLRIGAELLEAGAVPSEISRHVYEETPFGYLKVSALALSRAHLDEERGIVTASVTDEDLDTAGIDWGDVDGLIDTLRLAQEADVAALAKVHDDGRVKVSLRSRGATDVGSLAAKMGGGGHRLAAGFTVERDPEEVLEEVRQSVGDFR
jgi:phosphoesterase RecJ-like protein